MRTPLQVIASAMTYDHLPLKGARKILAALEAEGYLIVQEQTSLLPETERVFGDDSR